MLARTSDDANVTTVHLCSPAALGEDLVPEPENEVEEL